MASDDDQDTPDDASDEGLTGAVEEKPEGAKPPKIEIIPPADGDGVQTAEYGMLEELVQRHHEHLAEARIALAWRSGWTADKDGRLQLGKAQKASELNRKLHGFDFVILLNREMWLDSATDFTAAQKRALLDHELTHCDVDRDEEGEPAFDKTGRPKWRIRKHDIEEFAEVVQRNGLWVNSLEQFAGLLEKKRAAGAGRRHRATAAE